MELQHTVASLHADLLQITDEKASLSLTCHALQNVIVNIQSSASSVASSSSSSSPSNTSNTTPDECKPLFLLDRDKNSVLVLAQCTKAIQMKMLSCFRQLHTQGLAPDSIGQASLDILKWLVHTLCKEYIELQLCANNWKTMRLMTDNYSQWYSYHVKNKGKHMKVEANNTCPEDESISDNSDKHVAKRPCIDSDTTPEITQDPSPNRQTTPPPRTDKGKQKEVVILEVKNPLSNLAIKPRPRPIPPKIIATSTNSSPSANTSTPNIIPSPSNDITQLSIPEVQSSADAASLATKVELVAATPVTIDSKNNIIKKHQLSTKPMCELAHF
ncbi:hypothetical protein EDB19DRAFT_1831199 [Suillus lakei]|nr:hypothetical protein EDB19DRAFT_1831199 [Suillus lakei]